MGTPYQILMVDDDPDDIKLAEIQLSKINMELEIISVDSREAFQEYLNREPLPDLVICDYQLPEYNGEQALRFVRDLHDYLPFILVTGHLDEEEAVELMRKGASDIITKQKLDRLGPAVQRELINFRERREAQRELEIAHKRFQSLVEQGGDVVVVFDEEGTPDYISPSIEKVFGYPVDEAMSVNLDEVTHPEDLHQVEKALEKAMKSPGKNISVPPVRMKHKDGTWRWCKTSLTDLRHQPSVAGIVDNIRDIHEQVVNARNNKLMLNNTEDSFVYINRDLAIQSFNDRFASNYKDAFGIEVKHGQSILEYAQPERRKIVKDIYDRVLQGETIEGELPIETNDGNTRYFQIKYKPARDENENIIGSFISLIEITDEKKIKLELEKNEARYRALVENGKDVIVLFDKDFKPFYMSQTIENVLGYSVKESKNLELMSIVHPDDIEGVSKIIEKSLQMPGETLQGYKSRVRHKDGTWRWVEATVTNFLDDPNIGGIVDNFRDITERVEAEQKIVEAKNQYQSLIQTVDGIVWEADAETLVFNYVSPQAQKTLGYSPEEWIGKKDFWLKRIHPEDRERVVSFCSRQTDKGVNHVFEYRMRKADGDYIWLRDVVTVVKDQGETKALRGLMIDIDQEKELELKLKQAYQLAKIGNWELNLVNDKLYWSNYVKELHEVDDDYEPNLDTAINFYKKGGSRDTISKVVENSVEKGESFDVELQIETAKGNERWVRVLGRPEFVDDTCVRIFGSTQDITERKKAQIERRKAEEKHRNVVEHSTNMFYEHDTNGVLTYVSPQSKQFLGYPPEEARKHWTEFITDHPLNKKGEKNTQWAIDTGEIQEPYELQLKTADNRIIWVEVHEAPLVKDGNVEGIVGSLTDITDRKDVEERLKESLERYEYLSKATYDAIWDWNLVDDTVFWGEGFEKLFGHSMETLAKDSSSWTEYIHADDEEWVQNSIHSVIEGTDNTWYEEYRYERADGSFAYVEDRGFIIRNERGEAERMIGAMRDVSEKKELEKLLEQAQRMAKIGAWEVDLETEEVYWSAITREIHETEPDFEPNLKEGINFYKKGESRETIQKAVNEAIENGTPWDVELQIVTAKGNEKWVRAIGAAEMKDGECIRLYGSFQDIHDRKAAQEKMVEAYEQRQQVLETTTEAYFALDRDYTVTYWNKTCEEITDISREEVLGHNLFETRPETRNLKLFTDYQKEILEYTPVSFEEYNPEMDRWFDVHAYPTEREISVFFRDISERKFAEKEIRDANEKLRKAQEIAKLGYWELDVNSKELFWSDEIYSIWGIDKAQVSPDFDFFLESIHPDDLDEFLKDREKALLGETNHDFEHRIILPDGQIKWVHEKGSLKKNGQGDAVTFSGTVQDITEKKEIEELLKQTNQLAKVGSWEMEIRENGDDSMYWSEMTREILEVDEDSNPTLTGGFEFYTSESKEIIQKAVEKAISTGISFDKVLSLITDKGNKRWVRCIGDAEFIDGKCRRIYGSFQDITDRIEAEQERVRILESISDAFYALDSDWNFTYFNNEAANLLNRKAEDLLGENLWKEFPEAGQSELYDIYTEVAENGRSRNFEYYYPPLETWFEINAYSNEGGLSVFFKNINDRKRSEEQIKRINERFEKVTEATNDAIWDFDVAEDELFWGKGFDTLFGYDLDKIDPNLSFLLSQIHSDDRERVSEKIKGYMAPGGESDWFEEYRFRRVDGTYAYVMDRAVFIRDKSGRVTRVVGAMTDLTRQKENEESLKNLNKQLEEHARELAESNAELEQFAYVASHDLQEPLRMVSSFLTQLEKKYSDKLDEKALQYIDFAVDGASRMRQIILDLLNYSRLNRDQEKREAADLNDVVEDVLTLSRSRVKNTGAKITVDHLPTLEVNPGAIKQVFQNLVSNALKYQQSGSVPEVHIKAEEQDDHWRFAVRDNGIGIREEFQDTVFQIFQRLHTREEYSGTGIGLAIAKKIVERHGGKIWVESEEGEGSIFYFTIEK